jgi:hypothetical protein
MDAATQRAQLREAVAYVRARCDAAPQVGLILGTGLGAVAAAIEVEHAISYDEIPYMPPSTVESHAGRLLFGTLAGCPSSPCRVAITTTRATRCSRSRCRCGCCTRWAPARWCCPTRPAG